MNSNTQKKKEKEKKLSSNTHRRKRKRKRKKSSPILVLKHNRVYGHKESIIVSVPLIQCMGPVLQLQGRMPIAGLSEGRILWLRAKKPVISGHTMG